MRSKRGAVDDGHSQSLVTEKHVEDAGDIVAKQFGALVIKGFFRGRRGWPDKFYFFPGGRLLLVEYKRPGEEAEPDQKAIHRKLRRRGFQVLVIDQVEEARSMVRRFGLGETVDPEAEGVGAA